jgi:CheY-like chemotaxis protein/anti-sigma regulatory factor (Ser/Thr protein kinase)
MPPRESVMEIALESPATKDREPSPGPLILIADDDPMTLKLLRATLEMAKFRVVTASNGLEVLQNTLEHKPDLLLLDVMMPHLSGFQVCRQIKEDPKQLFLPVILVTGMSESEHKVNALNVGADDLITKPYLAIELLARVRSLLRMRHLIESKRQEDLARAGLERELALEKLRREEETRRKFFYKEVIYAVSGGKLVLWEPSDLKAGLAEVEFSQRLELLGPRNVRDARRMVEHFMRAAGAQEELTCDLALCASEAATNVLKHAGTGYMQIGFSRAAESQGMKVSLLFEDEGPGIAPETLPRATLQKGFSTLGNLSLGMGFHILLELLDRIYLCPGPPGTRLWLEKFLDCPPTDVLARFQVTEDWSPAFGLLPDSEIP